MPLRLKFLYKYNYTHFVSKSFKGKSLLIYCIGNEKKLHFVLKYIPNTFLLSHILISVFRNPFDFVNDSCLIWSESLKAWAAKTHPIVSMLATMWGVWATERGFQTNTIWTMWLCKVFRVLFWLLKKDWSDEESESVEHRRPSQSLYSDPKFSTKFSESRTSQNKLRVAVWKETYHF